MRIRTLAGAAIAVVALAGCTSTVSGRGAGPGPGGTGSQSGRSADFPSGSSSATPVPGGGPPSTAQSPRPSPRATYHVLTVHGTSSGRTITARVYAADTITDCAAHAYGPVVAFLRKHPCRGARRVLATTVVGGRTAVLSTINTGFTGTAADPYAVSAQFKKLELENGTGSIDDLLRDGHPIAGIASRIPDHEVFEVGGQDNGVYIFDAWYAQGSTDDHDAALHQLAVDVYLTPLTNG